jgi:xanthine dehydrogenase molybdopterin-binding subunit B
MVKPAPFACHRAHSVDEAVALLAVTRIGALSYLRAGHIKDLSVTAASRAPGIAAVVTAADLPPGLAIPVRLAVPGPDLSGYLQPVLGATATTVRYVGEPVAVVVGDDPYACEDAAELVEIDIAERDVVLDAGTAESLAAAELTRGYGDANAVRAALGLAGGAGQLPLLPPRVRELWEALHGLRQQDRPGRRAHPRAGSHRSAG